MLKQSTHVQGASDLLAQVNALRIAKEGSTVAPACVSGPGLPEVTYYGTLRPFFGENLRRVISLWRQIKPDHVDSCQTGYYTLVSELAFDVVSRFNQEPILENMGEMMEILESWVDLCRKANLSACTALQFLADARRRQYSFDTSQLINLESAASLYEEVTRCYPACAGSSLVTLRNYQYCTEELWERMGGSKCAQTNADVCHLVVKACPIDHPDRMQLLWKEGKAHMTMWQLLDDREASKLAVFAFRNALSTYKSDQEPDPLLMQDLAIALCNHGNTTYDLEMMKESEMIHRSQLEQVRQLEKGLMNTRYEGLDLANAYNCLACVLYHMYTLTGDITQANEALDLYDQAIRSDVNKEAQALMMANMANCLHMRYETHNDVASLDEALRIHHKTEALCTPDTLVSRDHDFHGSLMYQHLYACRRRVEDIDMSNSLGERHLAVLPLDHPGRWNKLDLLALGYYNKYLATGDMLSLRRARDLRITAQSHGSDGDGREVLSLAYGVIGRPRPVSFQDLPEAIAMQKEVIHITPYTHAAYTWILVNLACDMSLLFEKSGDEAYIEDALHMCHNHMTQLSSLHRDFKASLSPVAALDTAKLHATLCYLYLGQSAYHHRKPIVNAALDHLSAIMDDNRLTPRARVHDAKALLDRLELVLAKFPGYASVDCSRIAAIYQQVIQDLPLLSAWNLEYAVRLDELREAENLGTHGAIHAIRAGQPQEALRLLEQARGVFWTQVFCLQDPQLQQLPSPVQLELKSALQQLHTADSGTSPVGDMATYNSANIDRVRQGARINQLVAEARELPGMGSLFRSALVDTPDFAHVASDGPLVTLIAKENLAYALVVPGPNTRIIAIELPGVNEKILRRWIDCIGKVYHSRGSSRRQEKNEGSVHSIRAMKLAKPPHSELLLLAVLAEIWGCVTLPIFNTLELKRSLGRGRPRLFWCPTGGFTSLPLHAAGVYSGSNPVCCSDYIISSYTPTLTALDEGRRFPVSLGRDDLRALLVAESHAPGYELLAGVQREVSLICQIMGEAPQSRVNTLSAPGAIAGNHNNVTCDRVLGSLPSVNVLHLACHGIQDATSPLKSGFALHDGLLTIERLLKLELTSSPRFLAYLSACETAKGDHNQPDQIIHLAAAMLYSGFRNIIATMWTMGDSDGPIVAKIFYEELIRHQTLTTASVAYALDVAVNHLKDQSLPPSRWATFVHIGS